MEQILLKEDGDQILLETGDAMLLEQVEAAAPSPAVSIYHQRHLRYAA